MIAKMLAKTLLRLSESVGGSIRRLGDFIDRQLRQYAKSVDRQLGHEKSSAGKSSASLFESLHRLVEQIYKNLSRKKRRNLKEIVDVCIMALEAPITNDVHMAGLIRTQRMQREAEHRVRHQSSEEKKSRIQLPPRKFREETKPAIATRLKNTPQEEKP